MNTPRDLWYGTSGPREASIVIVGEAWGEQEAAAERPFVGMSGRELDRILAEAGLNRAEILCTNTVAARPMNNQMWRFFEPPGTVEAVRGLHPSPFVREELERLYRQLSMYPRSLVIATGNYALWALTSCTGHGTVEDSEGRRVPTGIMDWRGSMWYTTENTYSPKTQLLPIVHPAAILRQWSNRAITIHDLKARVPLALKHDWRPNPAPIFWAPPTFEQAVSRLKFWIAKALQKPFRLVCDIETAKRLITTIGFSDSPNFAMSIPFVKKGPLGLDSYWTIEQEVILVDLIRKLFSMKNVEVVGQNFSYDTQYIEKTWGIIPNLVFDTMGAQHLLWPGISKGLDYISSLYCRYHWYWKDDGKEWDVKGTLSDLLVYNCWDCVRTYEAMVTLEALIKQLGLETQWVETMRRHYLALRMMRRGVRIDTKLKHNLRIQLIEKLNEIYAELERIIPQQWVSDELARIGKNPKQKTPWYRSPTQQKIVFQNLLGMKLPRHRKTKRETLGKEALNELPKKYPIFTGLFSRLGAARSVGVFQSHFVEAVLDPDNRMRCNYNPSGTETYRWNSSTNPFGRGTNLQNIPVGDED